MVRTVAISIIGVVIALGLIFLIQPKAGVIGQTGMQPLRLDIEANNVKDLSGIQADVIYNPDVVQYVATEKGPFLDSGNSKDAMLLSTLDPSTAGVVKNIIVLRLQPTGVSGSGIIATVHFERIATGDPGINLQNVVLSDSNVNPLPPSDVTGAITVG